VNARSLAVIALKVWGAILIADAVRSIPTAVLLPALSSAAQVRMALDAAVRAAVGAGVIVLSDRFVRCIVPDGPPLNIDVYASELGALAFAVLGLYLAIEGAGDIATTVYTLLTRPPLPGDRTVWYVWEPQRRVIVKAFVEIAAGVGLMFGRKALVNAWWSVRRLGIVTPDGGH
jgi:hypothetical protein